MVDRTLGIYVGSEYRNLPCTACTNCIMCTPCWPEKCPKNLVLVYNAHPLLTRKEKLGKSATGLAHHFSIIRYTLRIWRPDTDFAPKVRKKIKSCLSHSQPLISLYNCFDVIINKQTCLNCEQWFLLFMFIPCIMIILIIW